MTRYVYRGDRLTRADLVNQVCEPVYRRDGKCLRGKGNMAVRFATGETVIVLGNRLRKLTERDRDDV